MRAVLIIKNQTKRRTIKTICTFYGFLQVAVVGKFAGKLQAFTDGSK